MHLGRSVTWLWRACRYCVVTLEASVLTTCSYDPPRALSARHAAASPTRAHAPVVTTATPRQTWQPVPVTAAPAEEEPSGANGDLQSSQTRVADPAKTASRSEQDAAQPWAGTEPDSTRTQTIQSTIWADVITTSIDYGSNDGIETTAGFDNQSRSQGSVNSQSASMEIDTDGIPVSNAHSGAPSAETAPLGPPSSYLRPQPLVSEDGVSVLGETLTLNDVLTVGNGPTKTTLSLEVQNGNTVLLYGTSAAALVLDLYPEHFEGHTLYHLSGGEYVVGSQTLVPGTAITVGGGDEKVTYSMGTSGGDTWLAAGTSTRRVFHPAPTTSSSVDFDDLAFTQASNGDFVLHGTTLEPGEPITIGSGQDRTTLAITSLQSLPAIVIDGTMTAQLSHAPVRANSSISLSWSSMTAAASTPTQVASIPATTASESGNSAALTKKKSGTAVLVWTIAILTVSLIS